MTFNYKTKDTCSTNIKFDINNNIVTNIEFTGGCNGNLKTVAKLLEGADAQYIIDKCSGINCGRRPTSCADQLAKAVQMAVEKGE